MTARNAARVVDIPAWLTANSLPAGTIETGTTAVPWVAENEKVADIERLFAAHPDKSFVLLGDSSHRDPDVYRRIRDKFLAQVKAVIIHDVKTIAAARLEGHHLVKHYAEASAVLFGLGVVDEAGARGVMRAAQAGGLAITDVEMDALLDAHRP